ncbi:MAG: hypothetical protein A4E20_11915 [Nitrospira sp. SG-bin2]|nr:MAG: hypothetical protein A4E20_11915 [Nitrospira sp. SG-bin2]
MAYPVNPTKRPIAQRGGAYGNDVRRRKFRATILLALAYLWIDARRMAVPAAGSPRLGVTAVAQPARLVPATLALLVASIVKRRTEK